MNCPNCSTFDEVAMEAVSCADTKIDRCPICGGILLDKGEFQRLRTMGNFYIEALDVEVEIKDNAPGRYCPKCNRSMEREVIKGVEIDVCKQCKYIWLDRGELFALQKQFQ